MTAIPSFTGSLTITSGHTPPPVLKVEPGDIVVISIPDRPNQEAMARMAHAAKDFFPDHRVMILPEGITLSTARPDQIHITD